MPGTIARLIVRDTAGNEREVEIARAPFSLGRQGDNDLVLLDNRISRQHARILREGDAYLVEDARSRHGTFVNGERVDSRVLKSGDNISLGISDAYRLTFVLEEPVLPNLLEEIGKASDTRNPQLHHLGVLLRVAQVLHRAPALEEVLTTVLDCAIRLTGAERGLLFLTNEEGEVRLRLARSSAGAFLPLDGITYSQAVVDRVVRLRQEEIVLEDGMAGRAPQETG